MAIVFHQKASRFAISGLSMLCLSASADMIDTSNMQPWEVCGLCHGLDGVSRMEKFPILAGQKADYIEKQFTDFNRGTRTNDGGQMQTVTTEIDPATLSDIAIYFTQQPLPEVEGENDGNLFATGRQLFEKSREGLTACGECHGSEEHAAPNLFGQHRDYLKKQLRDFKSGERANDGGVMKTQAFALREDELEALTYFLNRSRPPVRSQPRTSR